MRIPPCLLALMLSVPALAHDGSELPTGFQDQTLPLLFNQPTGLTFADDGRMIVWEKQGVVWQVENGVKAAQPMLDISEEVANYSSKGLKSVVLDPAFLQNGYLYLLYEVDRHHLLYHGTPQYDPNADDFTTPTIARVTRYKARPSDGFRTVNPGSRKVLIGRTNGDGFPIIGVHESGCLAFGRDGMLLASCGDGSLGAGVDDATQALADGIVRPEEDVGAFRAQMVDSMNGKLIRIDPATGDGVPNNPYYDPARPRSAQSRVWCRGFRNPFRIAVPGPALNLPPPVRRDLHGLALPKPGPVWIADVGLASWEEINLSSVGGENFGWPYFEGQDEQAALSQVFLDNRDAPNPLYDGVTCTQQYFVFQDLLIQDSLNPPFWPNPCNGALSIPDSLFPTMHTRPVLDWGHKGPARTPTYDAQGNATITNVGDPGSPVAGSVFQGSCTIAGAFYTGRSYPPQHWNSYFHTDYTDLWLKEIRLDSAGRPMEVRDFGELSDPVVGMAVDPVSGDLFYATLNGNGELHRIKYFPNNTPPIAEASVSQSFGPEPLFVTLDGTESQDPDGQPVTYRWDFGDGTPPSLQGLVTHTFPLQDVTTQATAIIAHVLELNPPQTNLGKGYDPVVVRDGVYPKLRTLSLQYFTHYLPASSKAAEDWVGYEFAQTQVFEKMLFQEGAEFPPYGGWLHDVRVQVRSAGVWSDAPGLAVDPPFAPNDGVDFGLYELSFQPTAGDAIRIIGTPGGNDRFFSLGELRVVAQAPPVGIPYRFDVVLTVTDDANATDSAVAPVWINNTPPVSAILSPPNGMLFDPDVATPVNLLSQSVDLEHTNLFCSWLITLHHNTHVHPEPVDLSCQSTFSMQPHNEGPGEIVYWEFQLTVSDPLGLSTSVSHYAIPQADCNLNGFDDTEDIQLGRSLDLNLNGIPDECEIDCNGNGIADVADLVIGISADANGDGIPDECQ